MEFRECIGWRGSLDALQVQELNDNLNGQCDRFTEREQRSIYSNKEEHAITEKQKVKEHEVQDHCHPSSTASHQHQPPITPDRLLARQRWLEKRAARDYETQQARAKVADQAARLKRKAIKEEEDSCESAAGTALVTRDTNWQERLRRQRLRRKKCACFVRSEEAGLVKLDQER